MSDLNGYCSLPFLCEEGDHFIRRLIHERCQIIEIKGKRDGGFSGCLFAVPIFGTYFFAMKEYAIGGKITSDALRASSILFLPVSECGEQIMAVFESIFDISYLTFDASAGIAMLALSGGRPVLILYGLLSLLLGAGDAFHLIPRVRRYIKGNEPSTEYRLGLGLKVSSITMTLFYLLLYVIYTQLYGVGSLATAVILTASAVLRIILCLFPQNNWYHYEGSAKWSLARNLPFAVTGICMIVLFLMSGTAYGRAMTAAILVSFGCYIPVTIFAKKYPAVGALMMPKTIAYVCMIVLGLRMI